MAHEPSSYDKVGKIFKDKDFTQLLSRSTLGARGFSFRSEAAIVMILPREKKKTLWTWQLQTSLPCDFETKHLTKPVFAGSVCFCN